VVTLDFFADWCLDGVRVYSEVRAGPETGGHYWKKNTGQIAGLVHCFVGPRTASVRGQIVLRHPV
jgi:hypothetical protein